MEVHLLKKLYLLPRQRSLFKKQRRLALKVESSSTSAPSEDSDPNCDIFRQESLKSILVHGYKNMTDRRLLVGILDRDNDMHTRKMKT